ncbi:MAG: hypothetical protein ACHQK9_01570 [Reyranellales bacterium]
MKSPLWFVLAGAIALGGLAGAVFYILPRLGGMEARLTRVVMPGSAALTLGDAGKYTIYYERKSVVDGRYYASETADGLGLRLVTEATGAVVPLSESAGNSSYTIGNREGSSIFTFVVPQPGAYRITGELAGGRAEPKVVLAVEHGMLGAMFQTIFGAIAIAFVSLGVAGAIVGVTIWQRTRPAA